jgi:hypothetical protein
MEEKQYAGRSTPALQEITSRKKELRGKSMDVMQRAILISFNILQWSF